MHRERWSAENVGVSTRVDEVTADGRRRELVKVSHVNANSSEVHVSIKTNTFSASNCDSFLSPSVTRDTSCRCFYGDARATRDFTSPRAPSYRHLARACFERSGSFAASGEPLSGPRLWTPPSAPCWPSPRRSGFPTRGRPERPPRTRAATRPRATRSRRRPQRRPRRRPQRQPRRQPRRAVCAKPTSPPSWCAVKVSPPGTRDDASPPRTPPRTAPTRASAARWSSSPTRATASVARSSLPSSTSPTASSSSPRRLPRKNCARCCATSTGPSARRSNWTSRASTSETTTKCARGEIGSSSRTASRTYSSRTAAVCPPTGRQTTDPPRIPSSRRRTARRSSSSAPPRQTRATSTRRRWWADVAPVASTSVASKLYPRASGKPALRTGPA